MKENNVAIRTHAMSMPIARKMVRQIAAVRSSIFAVQVQIIVRKVINVNGYILVTTSKETIGIVQSLDMKE